MKEHSPSCPRSQFWDAGEWQAPCSCSPRDEEDVIHDVKLNAFFSLDGQSFRFEGTIAGLLEWIRQRRAVDRKRQGRADAEAEEMAEGGLVAGLDELLGRENNPPPLIVPKGALDGLGGELPPGKVIVRTEPLEPEAMQEALNGLAKLSHLLREPGGPSAGGATAVTNPEPTK